MKMNLGNFQEKTPAEMQGNSPGKSPGTSINFISKDNYLISKK